MASDTKLENPELQALKNIKQWGEKGRDHRRDAWRENYELMRDQVTVNRLTQRQSVNLPIMKTTWLTIRKDIDDMPLIDFENLDNDKEAEVFQNEFWKHTLECNNAEIQDIVDKKQEFTYGRTFDSWQIVDGKIVFDIEDPEDILIDRYCNPYDLHSARFLVHTHIFKPLSSLKKNEDYDQREVAKLEAFFKTDMGLIKAKDNLSSLQKKNQKLIDMGVTEVEDPKLSETYVELSRYHVVRDGQKYEGKEMPAQIWVYVEAEDMVILMRKPQEKIFGVTEDNWFQNHYTYHSWSDDVEKQDFWSDGKADIVRTPNKVQNAWFSQEIERRTLSNLGMTFYDSSIAAEGFMPNTWEPHAWGFYGVPGKPKDFLQRVEIPMNDGNLESINFITGIVEKATGSTPTAQGVQTEHKTTLGEVQLALGEAKARTKGTSKFYTHVWKQRAQTFLKLIEGSSDKIDAVKIYKKGKNSNNVFEREIAPKDYMTPKGYRVKVWSQEEKDNEDNIKLQKLQYLKSIMPDNPKVAEIVNRKATEFAGLSPEEVKEVMDYEKQKLTVPPMGMNNGGMAGPATNGGAPQPTASPMASMMPTQ